MSMGQSQKMAISRLRSIKFKNNVTLLSQTLKVEVNKVSLFFCFAASSPRYGHFMKKHVHGTKSENGHILAWKAKHAKIRAL